MQTVKDLIAKLTEYNPDMPIVSESCCFGYGNASVEVKDVPFSDRAKPIAHDWWTENHIDDDGTPTWSSKTTLVIS